MVCVNEHESTDATRLQKHRELARRLQAIGRAARGSWERSWIARSERPIVWTLPSHAPEGFSLPSARRVRTRVPAKAGTGDPDPGARAFLRAPEARGLPEGTRQCAGHRWQGEPNRVRYGGAPFIRAPRQNLFCNLLRRISRQPVPGGEACGYFDATNQPEWDGLRNASVPPEILKSKCPW